MSRLARTVAALRPRETVVCHIDDGRRVLGTCASVERDQAGARVFLCPVDASAVPFQLCATRTADGWGQPYVERWDEEAEAWERYGDVVEVETQ